MTDYIGITEAQSDPLSPLTSELVKQLRDNPIALAQGATGAPRVRPDALDFLVDEVDPSGLSEVIFTDIEPAKFVVEFENVRCPITRSLEITYSVDNGSNFFESADRFVSVSREFSNRGVYGQVVISFATSEVSTLYIPPIPVFEQPDDYGVFQQLQPIHSSTPSSFVNAIRIAWSRPDGNESVFANQAGQKIRLYQTGNRPGGGKP